MDPAGHAFSNVQVIGDVATVQVPAAEQVEPLGQPQSLQQVVASLGAQVPSPQTGAARQLLCRHTSGLQQSLVAVQAPEAPWHWGAATQWLDTQMSGSQQSVVTAQVWLAMRQVDWPPPAPPAAPPSVPLLPPLEPPAPLPTAPPLPPPLDGLLDPPQAAVAHTTTTTSTVIRERPICASSIFGRSTLWERPPPCQKVLPAILRHGD
jgi:hypothetical protein